ncbi:MAG: T9SS type A sorting domain-containing protein, partial [Candidatus Desulfacyla sp.]
PLPDLTMQPGTFLLVWTDGQPQQGPLHASFKLNDEGEELGIFDSETTGYFLIDSVSWGMQTIDISFGRQTDGNEPWVLFNAPTPGYSNTAFTISEKKEIRDNIHFYPNPVTGGIIHLKDTFSGVMMDITGRVVWRGNDVVAIDVSTYAEGIYFLRDMDGNRAKVLVFD